MKGSMQCNMLPRNMYTSFSIEGDSTDVRVNRLPTALMPLHTIKRCYSSWCAFVCYPVLKLEDEEEPFVLEDTCVLNTDNMDAHSCDTSSLASSDSGDPAHLKRYECSHCRLYLTIQYYLYNK